MTPKSKKILTALFELIRFITVVAIQQLQHVTKTFPHCFGETQFNKLKF